MHTIFSGDGRATSRRLRVMRLLPCVFGGIAMPFIFGDCCHTSMHELILLKDQHLFVPGFAGRELHDAIERSTRPSSFSAPMPALVRVSAANAILENAVAKGSGEPRSNSAAGAVVILHTLSHVDPRDAGRVRPLSVAAVSELTFGVADRGPLCRRCHARSGAICVCMWRSCGGVVHLGSGVCSASVFCSDLVLRSP